MTAPKLNKRETKAVAFAVDHVRYMGGKVDAGLLNRVIGSVLRQATSKASDKRLRAAFTHYLGLTAEQLQWGCEARALDC